MKWDELPFVCDIETTARVLDRSVRSIGEDLARGRMQPAPIPVVGAERKYRRRQWSRDALQAWLAGGYLKFIQQARTTDVKRRAVRNMKPRRKFFQKGSRAAATT